MVSAADPGCADAVGHEIPPPSNEPPSVRLKSASARAKRPRLPQAPRLAAAALRPLPLRNVATDQRSRNGPLSLGRGPLPKKYLVQDAGPVQPAFPHSTLLKSPIQLSRPRGHRRTRVALLSTTGSNVIRRYWRMTPTIRSTSVQLSTGTHHCRHEQPLPPTI